MRSVVVAWLPAAVLAILLALSLGFGGSAYASDDQSLFDAGAKALAEGRPQDAIDQLELHADRAVAHPDASFNRGLAYVARVNAGSPKEGDLGRAAAAFSETLIMRPGDQQAERALDAVNAEVARQRSRRGKDGVVERPSLERVVVRLLSERSWAILALLASALLTVGLWFRGRTARAKEHASEATDHEPGATDWQDVAGMLLVPLGVVLLAAFLPLYVGARHLRLTTRPGVLVVREARLTNDAGATLEGEAVPEAAHLDVGSRLGERVSVRYGSRGGWLPASSVRLLRTR